MPWQLTSLLYVLFSSVRAVVNRKIGSQKIDLTYYALVTSFIAVLIVAISFTLISSNPLNNTLAWEYKHHIVFGGLLFGFVNLLNLKIFRYVKASTAVFLNILATISVLVFASVFTDEVLTTRQMVGAGYLFLAIIVIAILTDRQQRSKKRKVKTSVKAAIVASLGAALFLGPAVVNESYLIQEIGLTTYVLYGWSAQAFFAFLTAVVFGWGKFNFKKITAYQHKIVWLFGGLLGISGSMFVMSVDSNGGAAAVMVSGTARVAFTVFFAFIFLKERDNLLIKSVGLVLTAIGLYTMFS